MKLKHLFILVITSFIVVALAGTAMSIADIVGILPGIGSAVTLATGAAVLGTPTTDKTKDASSELLTNTISKKITEMKPSLAPLDTIIRHMGVVVPIKSWRTDFYAVDIRGIKDTVSDEVVIELEGGVWPEYSDIPVVNINIWNKDDNVMIVGVNGGDLMMLVGHIYQINRADKVLSVIWLNPRTGEGATIPENTKLVRIGNSKAELDAQTDPYAMMPQKEWNLAQIHMAQVEQGVYDKLHDKEVNWDISDFQAQSLYDMRRSMELTSLFGVRGMHRDPIDNDLKYFSGGIVRYILRSLTYPNNGAISNSLYIDWTKAIFTGNSGADTRFLFGGSSFIANMSKVDTVQKQIEAKKTEVVFGITFQRIETNFGVLLVKHHPLISDAGFDTSGIVLDMNHIEKHVFKPMDVRTLELDKSGQRRSDAYVVDEAFCLALRYPDTHALIHKL